MKPEEILEIEQRIVYALKNIYDPEIPVNIYDLGLIYDIELTPERVAMVRMTLTAPNCPMADELLQQVNDDVASVDGVDKVEVTLTFEPAWDKSRISEEAMLELGLM